MWFGRAFHKVAADVPISRLPYRIVLLRLGTSDVVDAGLRALEGVYHGSSSQIYCGELLCNILKVNTSIFN